MNNLLVVQINTAMFGGHIYIKTFFMLYFKFKFDWKSCVVFDDLNFQGLEGQELRYR